GIVVVSRVDRRAPIQNRAQPGRQLLGMHAALPCERTGAFVGLHDGLTAAQSVQLLRQLTLAGTNVRRRRFDHGTAVLVELSPVPGRPCHWRRLPPNRSTTRLACAPPDAGSSSARA